MRTPLALVLCIVSIPVLADDLPPLLFNKNFEGASIAKIEALGGDKYRCHVEGQYDARGRNRQTTWYSFRLDNAKGRTVTLVMTDFIGEYNDKPGAVPMKPGLLPVVSDDGKTWRHVPAESAVWDDTTKELTLTLRAEGERLWVAHVPPYTTADLGRLLADVAKSPHAVVETIGRSSGGRDLHMVTVTDLGTPDAGKKVVWLQARQHAWEAGTSYAMDGALRFAISDDPAAVELRKACVMKFTPMVDPDGVANGKVRFNSNGWDVNRHWDVVDLRDPKWLRAMPEVWYHKRAILAAHARQPIDLMVNMHNTETGEYVSTFAEDADVLKRMRRFEDLLVERTSYDPSHRLTVGKVPGNTTNALWTEAKVPVMLMEQRIGPSKKLGRLPTVEDRVEYGRGLIKAMGEAVK
ncbi:MAG: M14-type cytosolic carboxypeptidase [Phycisphaerae bacterium]|nr:M14-type cytosolic carboxypeptidase [Tepidisphaeraceae bacterium]